MAKRKTQGYSLRRVSEIVGVGFSTLSRLERSEGTPDSNTIVRLVHWLGDEGRDLEFDFQEVAFVHFRAKKNVDAKVVESLARIARHIVSNQELVDV